MALRVLYHPLVQAAVFSKASVLQHRGNHRLKALAEIPLLLSQRLLYHFYKAVLHLLPQMTEQILLITKIIVKAGPGYARLLDDPADRQQRIGRFQKLVARRLQNRLLLAFLQIIKLLCRHMYSSSFFQRFRARPQRPYFRLTIIQYTGKCLIFNWQKEAICSIFVHIASHVLI